MKIKSTRTGTVLKAVVISSLCAGALCWSAAAANVQQTWNTHCAGCHGKDGKGHTVMGRRLHIKDLTSPKVQKSLTDAQATKDIKNGIRKNGRMEMIPFGNKLSDKQIKELIAHIRSFKKSS